PVGRLTMRYWPLPSVTTVRVFSINAGLEASTVAPGSTAPELSFTTPVIVPSACPELGAGSMTKPKTTMIAVAIARIRSPFVLCGNDMRRRPPRIVGAADRPRSPRPWPSRLLTRNKCAIARHNTTMPGGCQRTVMPSHRETGMESNDLNRDGAEAAETTRRRPRRRFNADAAETAEACTGYWLCVLRGLCV